MRQDNSQNDSPPVNESRRRIMKAGAATGVAAVVWAEPTIKGLARRPAYAAVSTITGVATADVMFTFTKTSNQITNIVATPDNVCGETGMGPVSNPQGNTAGLVLGENNPSPVAPGNFTGGWTWDSGAGGGTIGNSGGGRRLLFNGADGSYSFTVGVTYTPPAP